MSESCLIDEGGTPYTIGSSHRFSRTDVARLARYAATSGVAFAVSETTLLILYGLDLTTATVAALIASLAGTVPSYLLSRYWIWREAARERALRQVILYWIVSISCIALHQLADGCSRQSCSGGPSLPPTGRSGRLSDRDADLLAHQIRHLSADHLRERARITRPRGRTDTAAATRSGCQPWVRGPTGRQAKTQLRPQHRENGSGPLDRPFPML